METSPSSRSMSTSGRMRPAMTKDTEFFWQGTAEHRLLIQLCTDCGTLRHPPGPACPSCQSFDWDTVEASGRGTLHSYVEHHHPPVPGFDGPVLIGLVDLDEGTRLIANIDADVSEIRIGQRVSVGFLDQDEGWTAPYFSIQAS